MKKMMFILLSLAILTVGMAMAADPIPAATETEGIASTTGVTVLGTVLNSENVVWTQSNMDIRDNPPLGQNPFGIPLSSFLWLELNFGPFGTIPILTPERQSMMSYTESILADNGYSEFNGMQTLDTGNRVANQDNFNSIEQFDYVSFEDAVGRATTSESILLDLASQGSDATERFLCPFSTGDEGYIPAYCNVYEMGSSFTGGQVSMTTQTDENHIARSADVPTQISYSIGLAGTGTASSWINAHVMEGRTGGHFEFNIGPLNGNFLWNPDTGAPFTNLGTGFMQSVDLVYKEKTTASGVIETFTKSMSVQDGVRRL